MRSKDIISRLMTAIVVIATTLSEPALIVSAEDGGVCRTVILDFHDGLGIDSPSVLSLTQLRQVANREIARPQQH